MKVQMEAAKTEVTKPFPQEIALNLDKRENEIVEGEPDEGDETAQPQRKSREMER